MIDGVPSSADCGGVTALGHAGGIKGSEGLPFERLINLVKAVLEVPIGVISLLEQAGRSSRALQSLEARSVPGSRFLSTVDSEAGAPVVIADATQDRRFSDNPYVVGPPFVRSCAAVPLEGDQTGTFGMLCAIDIVPRTFSAPQIEILTNLAALAVEELELRELADRDQLTGLLTRRGFLFDLEGALARFKRHQRPNALLILDIDHFKSVNDCFGHAAGDQVLKAVAECCRRAVRLSDSLSRLGGEEFGILLRETGPEEAWLAAERIREAIAALRFEGLADFKVTVSLGLAPLTCGADNVAKWAKRSDQALYAAKRGGRDRTALAF